MLSRVPGLQVPHTYSPELMSLIQTRHPLSDRLCPHIQIPDSGESDQNCAGTDAHNCEGLHNLEPSQGRKEAIHLLSICQDNLAIQDPEPQSQI